MMTSRRKCGVQSLLEIRGKASKVGFPEQGTETVEEGAREAVHAALLGADGPTGTFSGASGPIPW